MSNEYAATIGSVISVDGWNHAEALTGCDWDAAAFRLPSRASGSGLAVNVEVTGRKLVRRNFAEWVRVRVTFVGDCQENTTAGGFLLINRLY